MLFYKKKNKFCMSSKLLRSKNPFWFLLLICEFSLRGLALKRREMSEALDQAIERTKLHQSADREPHDAKMFRVSQPKNAQPIRMEELDVERLNQLIKTIDRGWVMPKMGFQEAVGSNFQYKKTCASIYRARHDACSHSGFGIMCFNFCFEQGDKLVFKCEDSSDLNFCKTNSNFDEYLTKYKGDAYRSKAYIHQMLTRCFLSAICNGNSLLNSTLVSGKGAKQKSVPKEHMKNNNNNQQQKSTVDDNGGGRRKSILSAKKSFNNQRNPKPETEADSAKDHRHQQPAEDKDEEQEKKYVTPKYIPYWRKLLVRKTTTPVPTTTTTTAASLWTTTSSDEELEEYESELGSEDANPHFPNSGEWEIEENRVDSVDMQQQQQQESKKKAQRMAIEPTREHMDPTTNYYYRSKKPQQQQQQSSSSTINRPKRPQSSDARRNSVLGRTTRYKTIRGMEQMPPPRYGWRPLKMVRKRPATKSIQFGSRTLASSTESGHPVGFWKEFQPNRWFHSIHFLTNTG